MTWADFTNSEYNIDDKFALDSGAVVYAEGDSYNRWLDATETDKIIAGQTYQLY